MQIDKTQTRSIETKYREEVFMWFLIYFYKKYFSIDTQPYGCDARKLFAANYSLLAKNYLQQKIRCMKRHLDVKIKLWKLLVTHRHRWLREVIFCAPRFSNDKVERLSSWWRGLRYVRVSTIPRVRLLFRRERGRRDCVLFIVFCGSIKTGDYHLLGSKEPHRPINMW